MLSIIFMAALLTETVAQPERQEHINIGIGFSKEFASLEHSLKKAELEVSKKIVTVLRISYLPLNFSASFYSALVTACNTTATENISLLIVVDDLGQNSWIIPWFSSVLRIPVSLINDSSAIGEGKGEFSTVFSMVPSVSEVSKAIAELARHFGWRDLAILTGEGKESTKITSKLMESMRLGNAMETKVLFHRWFNPRDLNDVNNIMQTLGVLDVRAIFLHCDSSEVKSIFSAAKKNGLLAAGRVWIVTEAVIEGCSPGASNCPQGLIGLRLRRLRDPGRDMEREDLVHDSVVVYADALRRLLKNEKFPKLLNSSFKNNPLGKGDLFFKHILNTNIQGKTGLIKFDKNGNRVKLEYEVVNLKATKNGTMEWVPVALWKQGVLEFNDNIIEWPGISSFPSVNMASKRVLRVVTAVEKPYVFYSHRIEHGRYDRPVCGMGYPCKVYNSNTNRSDTTYTYCCCDGLVIELLQMLEIDVGFQSDIHIVKDGKYGAKDDKTGEWNGMIGEVLRGEADFAIGDLSITESRSEAVDFSYPFLETGQVILVRVKTSETHWLIRFMKPYSWELWAAGVITVNIIILVLWLLDRFSPLGHYKRSLIVKNRKQFDVPTSLWYSWGIIFNVDADARPKSYSARMVTVCFAFAMTILASSYTANLAAVLVSVVEEFPVNKNLGIRDPKFQKPPQNFKFGTISDSLVDNLFKESKNPNYTTIWRNMKNVPSQDQGAQQVLSGELDAFIYDEPNLLYEASKYQQLRVLGPTVLKLGFGLAFPKNSIWTQNFSSVLISYQLLEVSQTLSNFWLRKKCGEDKGSNMQAIAIGMKDMSGVFALVGIGVGWAIFLLFVEFKVAKHGFPLSRIWTNNPRKEAEFSPCPAAWSNDHLVRTISSPQVLELSFAQRNASSSTSGRKN